MLKRHEVEILLRPVTPTRVRLHAAVDTPGIRDRLLPRAGLRHRGAVADPAREDGQRENPSGRGHRAPSYPERLRDSLHHCGGTHRGPLERQQAGTSPGVAGNLHAPHVLVIDEVGYLTYGPDAANVLFHVVNDRHLRKRPMIFITNKPLSEWGKVLHEEDMAAAILDRVLERGRFIHLDGPSGRTRHLNLQEILPAGADRARISGIDVPEFQEPTGSVAGSKTTRLTLLERALVEPVGFSTNIQNRCCFDVFLVSVPNVFLVFSVMFRITPGNPASRRTHSFLTWRS
jgi:IstB-like ATP binding protein